MTHIEERRATQQKVKDLEACLTQAREDDLRLALLCFIDKEFTLPADREDVEELVLALANPDSDIRKGAKESEYWESVLKSIKDLYELKNAKRTEKGTEWRLAIVREGVHIHHVTVSFDKIDGQEVCDITLTPTIEL